MGTDQNKGGSLLYIKKRFFNVRVTEQWHRSLTGCGVFCRDLQKPPGHATGLPCLKSRLDQLTFQGPFQPQPFRDSVIQTVLGFGPFRAPIKDNYL